MPVDFTMIESGQDSEGNLLATWRQRYEKLVEILPEAGPIYAAVDLLQTLDVPLRPALITELATEMSLSRAYHLIEGLLHRIRSKLELSPRLDWYRDPRRRPWGLALGASTSLLVLYGLFYVIFCVASPSFQETFFTAIGENLGWQLLITFSLMTPLVPLSLPLTLRLHRRQKRRHVQRTLDRLLKTEVPLREEELRPYEGQFEGNGTSRAWTPAFFAGEDEITPSDRAAASRLGATYLTWAKGLRGAGEPGPARSLATLAGTLAPDHPGPPSMLGTLWFDEGNYTRALAEFERSRKLNPTASAALALERIAWCHYQLDAFEQAEIAAGQALTLVSSLPAARWVRGLARLQQSQVELGLADCRWAAMAKESPPPDLAKALNSALAAARSQDWAGKVSGFLERDRPARKKRTALRRRSKWGLAIGLALVLAAGFLLGVPYVSRNLKENADFTLQLTDILLKLYPQSAFLLNGRGVAYYGQGDYERAIADYTEAIRIAPEYAYAYFYRARVYGQMGNYEQAIADYTEAIRLNPDNALAYNNRGVAYCYLDDYEQAITDYAEAMRLNPEYAKIYKDSDGYTAIAYYTEVIRLNPDDAEAYLRRGNAYYYVIDYEQAIADYTEAIRLNPDDALAYNNRGTAYSWLGDYEQAIANYTEAMRLDPEYAGRYRYSGGDAAVAYYTEVIRLNPDDAEAYVERGNAYRQVGDYEQAIADYTEAMRLGPEYAKAYVERGNAYSWMRDYEQAIVDYTEAVRVDPEYAEAYYRRGYAYYALVDYEQAITDLERAIELYEGQGNTEKAEGGALFPVQVRGLSLQKNNFQQGRHGQQLGQIKPMIEFTSLSKVYKHCLCLYPTVSWPNNTSVLS